MALIGLLLVLVELVISGLFLFEIFKLDIFPTKYFIMMIVILVLILLYNFTSQFTKAHYFGKFLSVLMSVILVFGYLVGSKVNWAFGNITNTKIETDVVDVIVLKHDSASSIKMLSHILLDITVLLRRRFRQKQQNRLIQKIMPAFQQRNIHHGIICLRLFIQIKILKQYL